MSGVNKAKETPAEITIDLEQWLSDEGVFAKAITGFQVRPQQKAMALAIQEAIQTTRTAIIEAGTGVGKTFAYLLPALASGQRVIISTGSKTLQDQLYLKDLPLVRKVLNKGLKTALLKGRSNYLCLQRLELTEREGLFNDRRSVGHLARVKNWSGISRTGDIAELTTVPRDAEIWGRVTSTIDSCLGADCEYYEDCHVVVARRTAQEADVVVVNHHLFFADLALKDKGFAELLPQANVVILDEAHQLPDIASDFFSTTFSSRQVLDWVRDTRTEVLLNAADLVKVRNELQALEKQVQDLRLAMDTPGQRAPWAKLRDEPSIAQQMVLLQTTIATLQAELGVVAERSKELALSLERLNEFQDTLNLLQTEQDNSVQWYETFTRGFSLTVTPLNVAAPLQQVMQELPCTWVMTSATLSVGGGFEHFSQRMGLSGEVSTLQLDSPFDYWHNSLLYLPAGLPEPQDADFMDLMLEAAIPVINACGGRTFMLFTSYRALNEAAERLKDRIEFPILIQGQTSQRDLIEKFRELGNAVLLGTASFWEGVDIRGEALSCVIIDKLPFASPSDPVLVARMDAIRQAGGSPFEEYQLPQAVIALKQGVGRLIRDQHDRGVLMLCDTRLQTRRYGQVFLDSLPRMPRTQRLEVVQRFFSKS
ncbi:ATP-dependent DNA helicase [Thiofilum flexile]|uniref:ATP-dependent DNA helicase n=1 Tax=Thiofilum flexile TaxID=125627 RepID=UPI00037D30CC|nr:ATP-dependent DNA helicase [Thiofilum flexile]